MNEKNEKNELPEKQEKQKGKKKKSSMSNEKKFYLFTAIGCAAVLLAIIIVAVAVTNSNDMGTQGAVGNSNSASDTLPDSNSGNDGEGEKPVVTLPEGMILPVSAEMSNDHGFYHNQSVGSYYLHEGVDFSAAVGTEVLAVEDGVVESIYKDDLLLGTEITIKHDDGLKSVYRFVTEAEGLKVGAEVKKGDVIATVAEATGNEYKDGAHLHFEIFANGVSVDPATYLTLEEK